MERLSKVIPVYKKLPGWKKDISNCLSYAELPKATKDYLKFISGEAEIKIDIISVGPKRQQTFYVD